MSPWWSKPTADTEGDKREEPPEAREEQASPKPDQVLEPEPEQLPPRKQEAEGKRAAVEARRRPRRRTRTVKADSEPTPEPVAAAPPPAKVEERKKPKPKASPKPRAKAKPKPKKAKPVAGASKTPARATKAKARTRRSAPPEAEGNSGENEPAGIPGGSLPSFLEELSRQVFLPSPGRAQGAADERKIALFCDLENVALGVRDTPKLSKFDIHVVLERLLEKGRIIVKKAYCDWERYSDYKRGFHEAGIEMIDIPQKYYSGKNSADIKMVVDAMDHSYSNEHLDTFVLLSGDSDFTPLVSKLKENNKYVIGIGVKNSSSNLLIENCDEFIFYEDVWRDTQKVPKLAGATEKNAEAFGLMIDSIKALMRENKDVLWGSMVKQTMQRKKPSFNEGYYGYSTFSELLEDAERLKLIKLKKDQRSGSYIVTNYGGAGR